MKKIILKNKKIIRIKSNNLFLLFANNKKTHNYVCFILGLNKL